MLSLKSIGVACAFGSTVLMGCSTHSADLQSNPVPAGKTPVTLQSHHWQLVQAQTPKGDADPQWQIPATSGSAARTVGLRFSEDQSVSVDRLCNLMHGSYQVQAQKIEVSRMVSTMMACSNQDLMQLEKNVGQQLSQARTWKISGQATPVLELQFESGAVWRLQGTPTHETLYGRSERIFLEVAPQKVACNHPMMPNAQCLQVREIRYSEQGLKQGSGAWTPYYGSIEGYTHQPGVRNVLRIKRFTRTPVPADASKYIDVLDMTVESEIMR